MVKGTGSRVIIIIEGRDAAGKLGTIKRFMGHLRPRGARVVAFEKSTDEENGQWYFQGYVRYMPILGVILMFGRSWFSRVDDEQVMGFFMNEEYQVFIRKFSEFEYNPVSSGIHILKFWFSVSLALDRGEVELQEEGAI